MPRGQTKHWRRRYMHGQASRWSTMLSEHGARERLQKEAPAVANVLDVLAGHTPPLKGMRGWTTFNDWLDKAYAKKYYAGHPVPPDTPLPRLDTIREAVFPTWR